MSDKLHWLKILWTSRENARFHGPPVSGLWRTKLWRTWATTALWSPPSASDTYTVSQPVSAVCTAMSAKWANYIRPLGFLCSVVVPTPIWNSLYRLNYVVRLSFALYKFPILFYDIVHACYLANQFWRAVGLLMSNISSTSCSVNQHWWLSMVLHVYEVTCTVVEWRHSRTYLLFLRRHEPASWTIRLIFRCGDWKRGKGKVGTVMQGWKIRELYGIAKAGKRVNGKVDSPAMWRNRAIVSPM